MTETRFRYLAFAAIIGVCGLLYGYTLSYPFLFDDQIYLRENPLVTEGRNFLFFSDFRSFATYSLRLGLDPDLSVNFILRPVTYLTFHLNYLLDGWNPRGFRAVNIAIHCANALILFELISLLVRASPKEIATREGSARFMAASGAFLFLVHPLGIESVTYIVQRFTTFGTLFYLIVVLTYFRANLAKTPGASRAWRIASVATLIVGMLSKEILFTAPFLLVIADYLIMGTSLKVACKRVIPHFLCLPIIPILMLMTSAALQGGGVKMTSALFVADPKQSSGYQYHYALTQFTVVVTYPRLILAPVGLNLDPDHPVFETLWDWRVLGAITIIATLVGGIGWWYFRRTNDLRRSLIFCGTIWYFLGLSIDSSIVPLPDVMAEHRSYLPSIGIFIALACGADLLRMCGNGRKPMEESARVLVPGAVVLWVLILGMATVLRHEAWSSEVAMWRDVVKKSPDKPRGWLNLGSGYVREHRLKEAYQCFVKYIKCCPNMVEGYVNLASVQADMGRFKEAKETALKGARFSPSPYDHQLHYILGRAWLELGDIEKSIACSEKVVALAPRFSNTHRILMTLYAKTGRYEKALQHARSAASLEPGNADLLSDVKVLENALAKSDPQE